MKLKIKNYKYKKGGYSILELVFYIALFATISLVVINAMITMMKAFRETAIQAEFVQSGVIMEKMSREIRQAYSIDATSTSTDLKLNTTGVNTSIEFKLVGSDLSLFENTAFIDNLNTPNIIVTGLTFSQITTVKGKAVKIVLSLTSSNDKSNRVRDFYDTIVLRGVY